jgi:hypothetical protein
MPGGYKVVTDADGRALAYIYAGDEPRRSADWGCCPGKRRRRLAVNIAKLPERLKRG